MLYLQIIIQNFLKEIRKYKTLIGCVLALLFLVYAKSFVQLNSVPSIAKSEQSILKSFALTSAHLATNKTERISVHSINLNKASFSLFTSANKINNDIKYPLNCLPNEHVINSPQFLLSRICILRI